MNSFLVEFAHKLDSFQRRDETMRIMDEPENVFETLVEDQQGACSHMMLRLENVSPCLADGVNRRRCFTQSRYNRACMLQTKEALT